MNSLRLTGLVAATHTPFQPDGSLHLAIVERQAEHLLRNSVRLAFIGGTTGECHSLCLEERRQLARRWIEVARGTPLNVVVHVGANCLADARALASQAGELGAVAIAALAPSYFKPRTVGALMACCADIASAAAATPFCYCDIPSMTGVSPSAGVSRAGMAAHPDARGRQVQQCRPHGEPALPPHRRRRVCRAVRD